MVGEHNLYNQVALVATFDFYGITAQELQGGFKTFKGIKRRQEVLGQPGNVAVIDDFAHHPTAIQLTLAGLKMRFGDRRLWAIFEPRSATSRRNTFQNTFPASFSSADVVIIAPPYNVSGIPQEERLDAHKLIEDIRNNGQEAFLLGAAPNGVDQWGPEDIANAIVNTVVNNVMPEDVIAVLSNGGFGGIHQKLLDRLQNQFNS